MEGNQNARGNSGQSKGEHVKSTLATPKIRIKANPQSCETAALTEHLCKRNGKDSDM